MRPQSAATSAIGAIGAIGTMAAPPGSAAVAEHA
jgi:hypothetical protein